MSVFDAYYIKVNLGHLDRDDMITFTTADGVHVLYYIDPEGRVFDDNAATLNYVYMFDGQWPVLRVGDSVAEDSELRLIETPLGLGVEYELADGGFVRMTPNGVSDNRFLLNQIDLIDRYTGSVDDVGFGTVGTTGADDLFGFDDAENVMIGGAGADFMVGGALSDVMFGGGGHDEMFGQAGGDIMSGNKGHDTMYGGAGDDVIKGGEGKDKMLGGAGQDFMLGGASSDDMFGGDNADEMRGGQGSDTMFGGKGGDDIRGNKGADWLYGDNGHDTLRGDAQNDYLFGGNGRDKLFGGDGHDYFVGGKGDDWLTGGDGWDFFEFDRNSGNDTIRDFVSGDDIIILGGDLDGFESLDLTQDGTSTVIDYGQTTITLLNVDASTLTEFDFFL